MLVVLVVNMVISLLCWTLAARLLRCCPKIRVVSTALDQATINCEQLRLAPLVLAEQQLQFLQLRQIYQNQTGQIDRLEELIWLWRWLAR
jgi:hypothetical protein